MPAERFRAASARAGAGEAVQHAGRWPPSLRTPRSAAHARRLAAPPLVRALALTLVLVNPWAPQMLALLGLFDNFFDFRRWAEPPQARPGSGPVS